MVKWIQEMKWPEIENYIKKDDIVLLPVGSTEQHGPHLPIMTDSAQPIRVAEAISERNGVLIAPPLWYGWSPTHLSFPGSISLRPDTLANVVQDVILSLIYTGFGRIIVIAGHTTMNFIPINPVLYKIKNLTGAFLALIDVGLIAMKEVSQICGREPDAGHAGDWETSLMLYLHEELVDMDKAVKNISKDDWDPFPALVAGDLRIPGNTYQSFSTPEEFRETNPAGSTGNPLLASKEKGRQIFEATVRNTEAILKKAREFKGTVKKRVSPIEG